MITIHKVSFDLKTEEESFARSLYGNWDSFCRNAFEYVVDGTLSRYDRSDEIIRLESLELDLGRMTEEDFYDLFPKRLASRLQDIFSAFILDPEAYSKQFQIIPAGKSKLEVLAFYLQHGYFHWEMEGEKNDFYFLIRNLLQTEPEALHLLIQSLGGNETIRDRLVTQLPDAVLEQIVILLEPVDGNFINNYSRVLTSLYAHTGHSEIGEQDFRDVIQNLIFAYLLYPNRGYFNRKQFVWQTIHGLSRRYNIHLLSLIDLLTRQVSVVSEGQSLIPELFLILNDIRKEVKLDKGPDALQEDIRKEPDKIPEKRKKKGEKIEVKNLFAFTEKQEGCNPVEGQNRVTACEIENAGLVLFSPYFSRLFDVLGYLSDDHKAFKNKEAQIRAIFVLQALVSDEVVFKETDLSLNKILTGYPLSGSLPRMLELTAKEKETTKQLLKAVMQNWEKMRNTSLEGFRRTFVMRQGKLTERDRTWELQVEERSVDVLLTTLPWNFRLIKTAYISKLIEVLWR